MALFRVVGSVLLLVGIVVGSVRTSSVEAPAPPAVPCTTNALAQPFTGSMALQSFVNFGCEGDWAFAWATVGTGVHQIGVTEVLHFDRASARWGLVSRGNVCKPQLLPSVVYRLGCFSN